MPWKNGLGVTREVIACPAPHDPAVFLWRISLATVRGSGPFSLFPGIDRTIAVLRGDGMQLTADGETQSPLTQQADPYRFAGEAVVHAESLGGETTDLNVMTLRTNYRHTLRRLAINGTVEVAIESPEACIVFNGAVRVEDEGNVLSAASMDAVVDLVQGQSLRLSADIPADVFLVSLERVAG
ncbi:HutD family protein [Sinorhizobium sp. BG8]|uniref:HutD/Ves family protein n=1 Tax=Sinorhizobium sp. BG8 TaxID=2613773 RepID=UPI00193CA3CE|nr:HutD family protein [Sinorhizobium sp. BG8]